MILASWIGGIILAAAAVSVVYSTCPNTRRPLLRVAPGAVLFVAGWLVLTYLFGVYVGSVASYNLTYGTLGGVVVVLIWLYMTGFTLLLGMELNAFIERVTSDRDQVTSSAE
jgi:membrane protein